ncbi:unnamed protein product [Amoebophrya sp. A25]|nr:unnamed protein product [Amoebophrya sp. A25]|eukprot:GSA25T00000862001.1
MVVHRAAGAGLEIGQKFAVSFSWFTSFVLFVTVFAVLSFTYHSRVDTHLVSTVGLFFAAIYGFPNAESRFRESVWRWVPLFSCGGSVLLATWLGETNYAWYQRNFYDIEYGHVYTGVRATNPGTLYTDAAVIRFSSDARLDNTRVTALTDEDGTSYCVAPVVDQNPVKKGLPYSFWAVGTGCCAPEKQDFWCGSDSLRKKLTATEVETAKTGLVVGSTGVAVRKKISTTSMSQSKKDELAMFERAIKMANSRHALPRPTAQDSLVLLNWTTSATKDKSDYRQAGLLFFWVSLLLVLALYVSFLLFAQPGETDPAHPDWVAATAAGMGDRGLVLQQNPMMQRGR